MTTMPPSTLAASADAAETTGSRLGRLWTAIEERLIALTDRANPILVKETRQALKSRQFVVTFLIVLVACWIVSFVVVAQVGPEIYYAAAGPQLLIWYYGILCFPLALIVPFSAFRSLAAEQEENTYDLLSITTLTSRQIVTGKLASAMVQMLVYLCAVSPFIAFTFLLRGVDAITLTVIIVAAVLGSLALSIVSLLVGAIARVRNTQVVISVALVLGLAGAFVMGVAAGYAIIEESSSMFRDPGFWVAMFAVSALYVTTFGLVHAAAAAQIAFVSENRSSALRRWMMAQQACWCGFFGGLMYYAYGIGGGPYAEFVAVAVGCGAAYWYFMGTLMTGEWPHLSRRVQRSLPQSTLGRAFLSLFNPGPGAGYLFAVSNLTMLTLAGLGVLVLGNSTAGWLSNENVAYFLILSWSYVVAFLGFGRLLINALRRWQYVPMAAAFLLHFVLVMIGIGVPTIIQLTSRELRNSGYTLLQMTNPVWTLSELIDRGGAAVQVEVLILIVPAAALIALLLNMRSVATELLHQRVAKPVRVAEEDAELHKTPPKPSSPWESDELDATPAE